MAKAKKALARLPWVDQKSINAIAEEQKVHFKVSEPASFNEAEIRNAFRDVNFEKVEVLKKPA